MEEPLPSFSFGRKFGMGFGVLVSCLSVFAIVVMLNYLGARHFWRGPVGRQPALELSPRTLGVLASITNEVKVIVYYDPQERLYSQAVELLREYAAKNSRIKLQLVNPLADPAAAQEIKARYRFPTVNEKNLIIFDANGRTKAVYQQNLGDFEIEAVPNPEGREFAKRLRRFRGEMEFTAALISVTSPRQYRAYFLEGHGEHDPASNDELTGYSKFAELLVENDIQPARLSLLGSSDVPADCSLLIIPGPASPLSEDELAKISRYLNQGGRLFVLFGYRSIGKRLGLEQLLIQWGVVVGESVVLDPLRSSPASRYQDLQLTIGPEEAHPVTRPLFQSSLHLLLPRPVAAIKTAGRGTETLKVDELLHTTSDGVLVRKIQGGMPEINPATDPRGVFSLIVAVEKGRVPGVSAGRGSTRMIVAGDSLFLGNQMIESAANRDFAALAINWLVDRPELLEGLGPKNVSEYKLNLTRAQLSALRWLLIGALPGGVLALGLLVWARRRN